MSASARSAILGRIRRSIGAPYSEDAARRAAVTERLSASPKGVIPARGQLEPAARVDLFAKMAAKADATVARIATYDDLPEAVAAYLREKNLPAAIRMGGDPRLAAAPFAQSPLTVAKGPSDGEDLSALSHAEAGIAETGTLLLVSGPDNPTSLNFLPEHHIVAVRAEDIVGNMEAFWPALRERCGKGVLPRSVNFITGPSRSADIEQTLLLGAHGPRALHVVIVG